MKSLARMAKLAKKNDKIETKVIDPKSCFV